MGEFRFENPAAFQLLWLIPVLWFIVFYFEKRRIKKLLGQFGQRIGLYLSHSVSINKRALKNYLRLVTILLFVFALASPQLGKSLKKVKSEGIELILMIDVSNSMLAEDTKPSRLDLAKNELKRLVDRAGGDRIGLIAFAGSAIVLSPVTQDKGALKMFIDSLSTDSVSTQGTEFKKALSEAESAFDRGGVEGDQNSVVTRAIVIASDGEDNEPGALEQAKKIAGQGIRIFTLGFGTEKGAPIPIRDRWGTLKDYKKDKSNKPILTKTKGTILKEIAKTGKGSFHHVTFGSNAIYRVYEDIQKLEKSVFDSTDSRNYDEKFQIILFFGVLMSLIEFFLGDRKPIGRLWKGRFEIVEE